MIMGAGVEEDAASLADSNFAAARDLARRLQAEFCPNLGILSVRLLISPPGCDKQRWHLDFVKSFTDAMAALIPVTPSTAENPYEVLDLGGKQHTDALAEIARAAGRPLETDEWQHLAPLQQHAKAVPLLLDSFELALVKNSHAFHRRGRNSSNYSRITFTVDMAPMWQDPKFVDLDSLESRERGRVAPSQEIDELDEQDAALQDWQAEPDRCEMQRSML